MLKHLTFSLLLLSLLSLGCSKVPQLARVNPQFYEISKEQGTSSGALEDMVSDYRVDLDKAMNMVIGTAEAGIYVGELVGGFDVGKGQGGRSGESRFCHAELWWN